MEILNNNIIIGSQVGGKGNVLISGNSDGLDWGTLEKILQQRMQQLEPDSGSYILAKEAKEYTEQKDKSGLKNFVRKYIPQFTKDIFCNLAASEIAILLGNILN